MQANYQRINNIAGWAVFILSTMVYMLTSEATASFWDCGEFISGAYKLQVVHSPGAPLFLLIAHVFTMLAPIAKKAIMVNYLSSIMSGFTIMFLFWTVTHFARKMMGKTIEALDSIDIIVIIGAGLIGAGAGTFVDSFWFSAVEGEVYASSAFFTAIVVWAALKWEDVADQENADRWLILIAYLMGLSIGVHLLNLLTIPMIIFVYYFRRFDVTPVRTLITFGISVLCLALVQYGIIQYLVQFASKVELLFVNSFGMPFNSGFLFFILLIVGAICGGLYYAHNAKKYWLQLGLVSTLMIIIGYSSYTMVVLRAEADTSINMQKPSNPFNLLAYLSRDQYGSTPLFYGQVFTAQVTKVTEGAPEYHKNEKTHQYDIVAHKEDIEYDDEDQMLFPRVWDSNDGNHVRFYKQWLGLADKEKPSFGDNIKFFLGYQVYYMYWRYIFWNFCGRQNDIEGSGNSDIIGGNWITGINFIDSWVLGSQDHIPAIMKNKAHNRFFMLPLILGILGLVYHYRRARTDFWLVFWLFFMTGLAIVIYLNQNPQQPRERDYSYAGSTYAYCMWIGLGLIPIFNWLKVRMQGRQAALLSIAICSIVPILMGQQGWDDHDRSNRYTCRDMGVDYLKSCAPNAILFTQGDNDTYPLWYCQEVEGIRTDVRIINTALLGVDWYIENLRRKQNESDIVDMTLDADKEVGENRNYLYYHEDSRYNPNQYYDLGEVVKFLGSEKPTDKVSLNNGKTENFMPTTKLRLGIDTKYWSSNNALNFGDSVQIPNEIQWDLPSRKRNIGKNDLVMLDIIANNMNKRPIYLPLGGSSETFLGLQDYVQQEGLTMRLTPIKKGKTDEFGYPGFVNSKLMYENVMHNFQWGGIDKHDVYLDETIMRMVSNLRYTFVKLSTQLLNEGKKEQAVEVLDKCFTSLPTKTVPLDIYAMPLVENYYRAGEKVKAEKLAQEFFTLYSEQLDYINGLKDDFQYAYGNEAQRAFYIINNMAVFAKKYGSDELGKKYEGKLNSYGALYQKLNATRGTQEGQ